MGTKYSSHCKLIVFKNRFFFLNSGFKINSVVLSNLNIKFLFVNFRIERTQSSACCLPQITFYWKILFIFLEDLVRPNLYLFSISEKNVKNHYQQFIGQNSNKKTFLSLIWVYIGLWIELKIGLNWNFWMLVIQKSGNSDSSVY